MDTRCHFKQPRPGKNVLFCELCADHATFNKPYPPQGDTALTYP